MPLDPTPQPPKTSDAPAPKTPTPDELNDETLEQVSGGVKRRTGDEDLEDLEVER